MTVGVDAGALAATLRRLEQRSDSVLLEQSLQRLVDACVALFPVAGCGLMLADEQSELRYAVASSRPAKALEAAQLSTGVGPCVDAYITNHQVATADVQRDERWPGLAPRLADSDVHAVLGVPVRMAGLCVGSLDVYRSHPSEWDQSEREALHRFGHVVETILTAAVSAEHADALSDQLRFALEYRVPIERAIGYLMARDGIDSTQAFNALRAAARRSRNKIAHIAEALLATGTLPEERVG